MYNVKGSVIGLGAVAIIVAVGLVPSKAIEYCVAASLKLETTSPAILLGTSTVQDLIKRGEITAIKEVMEKSQTLGMKTFDSALFDLFKAGRISLEEAIKNADSPNNLQLKIKLSNEEGVSQAVSSSGLQLEEIEEEEDENEQENEENSLSLS